MLMSFTFHVFAQKNIAIHSVTLKLLRRSVMAKCNVLFAQLDLVIIFHHFVEKGDSSALNGRC